MVSYLCLEYKCRECPEQKRCFGCEHAYILIKRETGTNVYKCSKCGNKLRLNQNNTCCECIHQCKGKAQSEIDKEKGVYKICSNYNNGEKINEDNNISQ